MDAEPTSGSPVAVQGPGTWNSGAGRWVRSRSGLCKQSAPWRKEGHPGPAEPLPTRGWLGETKLSCPGRGFSHLGTAPWARPPRTRRATGPHRQDSTGSPAHRPQPRGGARPSPGKQAGSASDLGSWPLGLPSRPPGRVAHPPRARALGGGTSSGKVSAGRGPALIVPCVPLAGGAPLPPAARARGHLSPAHLSRALSWLPVQHLQGSLKARQRSRHQPPTPRTPQPPGQAQAQGQGLGVGGPPSRLLLCLPGLGASGAGGARGGVGWAQLRAVLALALPHPLLLLRLCLLSGLATCYHNRPHPLGLEGSRGWRQC